MFQYSCCSDSECRTKTPSDKAPYVAKADKKRKEFEKTIVAYDKKHDVGRKEEEEEEEAKDFDRSKLEVNDEEHELESRGAHSPLIYVVRLLQDIQTGNNGVQLQLVFKRKD